MTPMIGSREMPTTSLVGSSGISVRQSTGTLGPVLMCHGNSLAAEVFDRQLSSALGQRYRMIALDLPGHGGSAWDPGKYTVAALVNAIGDVIEALELERPALVGHSLGGHLMAAVAAAQPAPRGLFVVGTPLLSCAADVATAFQPHPAVGLLFTAELNDDEVETLAALMAPEEGADRRRVARVLRKTDPRFRMALAADLQGHHVDEVGLAAALDAPVALVAGDADPLVNRAYLEGLALPNLWRGALQIIEGAGHAPQIDEPERFGALLGAFLDAVC